MRDLDLITPLLFTFPRTVSRVIIVLPDAEDAGEGIVAMATGQYFGIADAGCGTVRCRANE